MIKTGVFVLSLAIFASSLHIQMEHQAGLASGVATLMADSEKFLTRCHGCGPMQSGGPDSATVHVNYQDAPTVAWTIQNVGNKVALRADNGKYLSVCTNCWSNSPVSDAAFVNGDKPTGAALWTAEKQSNGKWAFKGSNGKYLARCRDCVRGAEYKDIAFVHATNPGDRNVQWTITYK